MTAFVRTPSKLPGALAAAYGEALTVVTGDLNDAAAVRRAATAVPYAAVVDASSSLPIRRKGQAAQTADRSLLFRSLVDAPLAEGGRIADMALIIVSGQVIPEPGGTYPTGRRGQSRRC